MFGKKKDQEGASEESGASQASGEERVDVTFSPEKAARFFEHAQVVHDATNYEYAMTSWLNGLRQDPSSIRGLEGFSASAASFRGEGKSKPSKEMLRSFSGRGTLERYLETLLQWGLKPLDAGLAVRCVDLAVKLGIDEPAYWIAERALATVAHEKKPRKDLYVKLMNLCTSFGAYDIAVQAGEAACQLDPSDGDLSARVRNLSARATMSSGGFDQPGEEGGFRRNIRDADRQRHLEEQSRIVKTEETKDRLIEKAKGEYESNPQDLPKLNVYVKALLERGRPEDETQAYRLCLKAYEETKQFNLRQRAGDIRIRQARRKLEEYRQAAESNPDDEASKANFEKAEKAFIKLEAEEYRLRVENYPTDLGLKYELGVREYKLGNHEEAIALFQEAQHDPKNRSRALNYLGLAFYHIGWLDEAVDTFRRALDAHTDPNNEAGLQLRYGLMVSLQSQAEQERELAPAEEAERLASGIAIQQINYRDIRERRDQLKKLISELKSRSTA